MKKLVLILALFSASITFAQTQFKISGTLISETDQAPIESATVYLETIKDSTVVSFTISDKNGKFTLEDKVYEESLNLVVSFIGYQGYSTHVKIISEPVFLKTIEMPIANSLDEIVIKSRAPITIKKDTLEFNVSSFKTKKDANVEDLLKELPGVEVDEDGSIKVNGKEVNKILVNGKPFFGNDPTITTRNLTKELIEKIQITDTKTKSEAYSGEEGSKDSKTINLTIKEENNKGVFGRVAAGAGTDKRYELAGMVNIFDNDQRISVLAAANNINSSGFSFGEIRKMFGGGNSVSFSGDGSFTIDGRTFGGGQGITTSRSAGANYADKIGEKWDVSGDYFYSGSSSENETSTQRENILPDSRYFTNSSSNSSNDTDGHSVNLGFDIAVDSTFLININPSLRYSKSKTSYRSNEASFDEMNTLTNQSSINSYVENIGKSFLNRIDGTKRFGNDGSFLKLGISTELNASESDDFLTSETNIFGNTPNDILRDQFSDSEKSYKQLTTEITYRLPIVSKKLFLDFQYEYRTDRRENIESTYDFDDASQDYTNFNAQLSTSFTNKNQSNKPGLELSYKNDDLSVSVESAYVFRTIENSDALRPNLSLKENFDALELGTNFRYKFSPKTSVYLGYDLRNSPPEISQLQPFQDVSDPLNTITGNPNLKPTNEHSLYMGFNSYDFQKRTGFYFYGNGSLINDNVVSKSTVDENFVKNTTFTNVDGNYRMYLGSSYSKSIKIDSLRSIKARVGLSANIRKSVNFNNDVQYALNSNTLTPNASLTFNWKKIMELSPNYRIALTNTRYDLEDFNDNNFIQHRVGLRTATFVPKNLEWRNDLSFNYNPNVASEFQKSSWFWNSTLAYSILKEQGTITLKVYDLLNQNTNAQRTSSANYIQDSQSTVLEQYFMLSFSWKFNSLGSAGESRNSDFHMMN